MDPWVCVDRSLAGRAWRSGGDRHRSSFFLAPFAVGALAAALARAGRRRRRSASRDRSSPAPGARCCAFVRPDRAAPPAACRPQLRTGTAALVGRDGDRPRADRQRRGRRRRADRRRGVDRARVRRRRRHRGRQAGAGHRDQGRDGARRPNQGQEPPMAAGSIVAHRHRAVRALRRGADASGSSRRRARASSSASAATAAR